MYWYTYIPYETQPYLTVYASNQSIVYIHKELFLYIESTKLRWIRRQDWDKHISPAKGRKTCNLNRCRSHPQVHNSKLNGHLSYLGAVRFMHPCCLSWLTPMTPRGSPWEARLHFWSIEQKARGLLNNCLQPFKIVNQWSTMYIRNIGTKRTNVSK